MLICRKLERWDNSSSDSLWRNPENWDLNIILDNIKGKNGNDCILGGDGDDDTISGDNGNDVCIGGPGNDVFKKCETEIQ